VQALVVIKLFLQKMSARIQSDAPEKCGGPCGAVRNAGRGERAAAVLISDSRTGGAPGGNEHPQGKVKYDALERGRAWGQPPGNGTRSGSNLLGWQQTRPEHYFCNGTLIVACEKSAGLTLLMLLYQAKTVFDLEIGQPN
jgi:hypothetical protein